MNRFVLPAIVTFFASTGAAFAQAVTEVQVVPEPATMLLVTVGAGYVLARRRKPRS